MLLREMNQSRVASSYLITSLEIPVAAPVPRSRGRASSTKDEAVIPTFVIPQADPPSRPCHNRTQFEQGCFECSKQGKIDLSLPADISNVMNNSLTPHSTVSTLENTALHPFLISNLRKCFVYQHKSGEIYYMAFSPVRDDKDRLVSLVVFGVSPLNPVVERELKKMLEVKLADFIASIISVSLVSRRTVLPTNHVQFLKDCGLSKRVEFVYRLPSYVTDSYFYCTLVKQFFSKSDVFLALSLQYNDRKQHLSSILHPATFGYDMTRTAEGGNNKGQGKLAHTDIFRPHLTRMKRVDEEDCDLRTVSPIFLDRKRYSQTRRTEKKYDSSRVVWEQGEFTLLYNPHIVSEKEKLPSASKRSSIKRNIGQPGGLALIEFEPIPNFEAGTLVQAQDDDAGRDSANQKIKLVGTGSPDAVIDDVTNLLRCLSLNAKIELGDSTQLPPNVSFKAHPTPSSGVPPPLDHLIIRIFPTRGVDTKNLLKSLLSHFNDALLFYCTERIFSVYQNRLRYHQPKEMKRASPQSNSFEHTVEIAPGISGSDLLRAWHALIRLDMHHHSPISLPQSTANCVHRKIMSHIFQLVPQLQGSLCTIPIKSHLDNSLQKTAEVMWLQSNTSRNPYESSCIVGENFLPASGDNYEWKDGHFVPIVVPQAILRWMPDYSPESSLLYPIWLRKRRYAIEVTVRSDGISSYFFNIEKKLIDNVLGYIAECTKSTLIQINHSQNTHMHVTGLNQLLKAFPSVACAPEKLELISRLQNSICCLFWSQLVLSRLYMFRSEHAQSNPTFPTSEENLIPISVWKEGIVLSQEFAPIPSFHGHPPQPSSPCTNPLLIDDSMEPIDEYLIFARYLLKSLDCFFVGKSDSQCLYIILPLPRSSSVYTVELDRQISHWLLVTRRVADCRDIIQSIASSHGLDEELLLSPAARSCLFSPSVGTPNDDGITSSNANGDNPRVVDMIYGHPSVEKLTSRLIYATLATLFFYCPSRQPNEYRPHSGKGDRIIQTIRMLADELRDDVMISEQTIFVRELLDSHNLSSSLPTPTALDIISSFATLTNNEQVRCIPRNDISVEPLLLFRYLASADTSHACSRKVASNASHRRTHTHSVYKGAILGISLMMCCSEDESRFSLISLLFSADKVIGTEKDLQLDVELEEKLKKELRHLRFLSLGIERDLMAAMKADVISTGKKSAQMIYNRSAWDVLYSGSILSGGHSDESIMNSLHRISPSVQMRFLDFLQPAVNLLTSPPHVQMFRSILQRLFSVRLCILSEPVGTGLCRGNIIHYMIRGEESDIDLGNRYFIDIQAAESLTSQIKLYELQPIVQEEDAEKQKRLVEHLVDCILYASMLICEDDTAIMM